MHKPDSLKTFARMSALALSMAAVTAVAAPQAGSLQASAEALGVSGLKTIELAGTGHWFQFGQAATPGEDWPQFDVSSYTATINYETPAARVQQTRKQAIEEGRARPAPVEQKVDQWVSGAVAWNVSTQGGAPVAQAQPAALEERVAEIWTTPQGFLKAALANNAKSQWAWGGSKVSFTAGKNRYVGKINKKNQLESVTTWIDNPVLGDTPVEYRYSDYKDYSGLQFPEHILRVQGGHPVLALKISSVKTNVEAGITAPADVASAAVPAISVSSETLAPGVFYLKGGTHHSVAIEQRDHVVVVEAPQNEARSEAVIAKVREIIPGKPIRFLINTHQHFDHSGGLRTYVDEGATIVTHKLNKPFYKQAWSAPRTLNQDRLARSGKSARFETFSEKYVLNDGQRSIEIHQLAGNGHNDAFALVYLPAEKILIEADAFTPTAATAPLPTAPNPYSVNLHDTIQRLKLDVDKIAALHGPRVVTIADLRAAIGQKSTASN